MYYQQYNYDCDDQFALYHFFFYRFQVMKTCKRLGIKTVAIYSEADANAVCFDKFLRILIFAGVIHTRAIYTRKNKMRLT